VSFLSPAVAWALPPAAAPIILHLLFLRRARTVRFSDLTLLRRVYLQTLPTSRLRQWLLLALRCLLLAALVIAFARPVLRSGFAPFAGASAAKQGLRLVLLLDTSYSMGYRTAGVARLELARKAGRSILASLKPEDKVAVAAFSDRAPALSWSAGREAAEEALGAPITSRTTDANAALEAAYAFLANEPAAKKGVVLLSDNAAHAFRGPPSTRPDVSVLTLDWRDAPVNAFAADVQIAGSAASWEASLEAAGSGPRSTARLWLGGRLMGERLVTIPGRAAFQVAGSSPGWSWGWAELREDNLPADDRFYFSRSFSERPRVLVLSSEGDFFDPGRGGRFLRRMFSGQGGSLLPYDVEFLDLRRASASDLAACRAVVLAASGPPPEPIASALRNFVRQGGGLLVLLERGLTDSGALGLSDILPAEPGPPFSPSDGGLKLARPPDAAPWKFDWSDFQLENVKVDRAYSLRPWSGASVWLTAADGRPLLLERAAGSGRTLLWASSLDADWTNLGLKPIFAAWLNACLGRLSASQGPERPAQVVVGQAWHRTASKPVEGEAWIETPDRRRVRIEPRGRRVEFDGTEAPGLYWFEAEGRREPFAVNLDRSTGESELGPARTPFVPLDPEQPAEGLRANFYGRETRWAFLYLALAAMAGELALSGARRPEAP
jgi:hypothetical protein